MKRRLALIVLLVPGALLTGCGAHAEVSTRPKTLDGATIASRANAQLEKENPTLTHGALSCADVKFEVGATARCTRTVVLDDGRLVRIGATVTIDEVTGGGHYKIEVDDRAKEFGLTGRSVLADLARQYARRYGAPAPSGSCPPYLAGKPGTTITCTLAPASGKQLRVEVRVTRVDPERYSTGYTFRAVG